MHRSEEREHERCAVCDADVGSADRIYVAGDEFVLCFECAIARGGSWDAEHERWVKAPDVSSLPVTPA